EHTHSLTHTITQTNTHTNLKNYTASNKPAHIHCRVTKTHTDAHCTSVNTLYHTHTHTHTHTGSNHSHHSTPRTMMGAHLKRTAVAISQGGSTDPPFIVLSLLHSGFFPFHPSSPHQRTRTHTQTHKHTHTYAYTHMQTHTHTHTHKQYAKTH